MTPKEQSFAQYGVTFQRKIMQALLMDHQWARQLMDVLDVKYFDVKYLAFLAECYYDHSAKYKTFPSISILATIIKDRLKIGEDEALKAQIISYLQDVKDNPDPGDLQYVKDKSLDFCRKQALKAAFEKAIDQMAEENYDSVVDTIKKAVQVGTPVSAGHDFAEDYESRFSPLVRNPIPTGFDELDAKEYLQGGLGAGELGIASAATGAGKSHFLVSIGCAAIKKGYNVIHYTFELSENAIGLRYDSNLCDINSNDIINHKDEVLKMEAEMKLGRLVIKQYPPNFAGVNMIRGHIEKLFITKGFKPDIIIIDYIDNMSSSRHYESPRHELKLLYEEVRGLAFDLQVPVWSASQSNKEGANADVVDLTNMAEAYGKGAVADVMIGISRKSHEKALGTGRFFLAKNRFGRDGVVFPIKIDTSTSRFTIVGTSLPGDEVISMDKEEVKDQLRRKWKAAQAANLLASAPQNEAAEMVVAGG